MRSTFRNSAKGLKCSCSVQEVSMHRDCQSFDKLGSKQSNLFLYVNILLKISLLK